MKEFGFQKVFADECLWILREGDTIVLIVIVYVDDMGLAGPKLAEIAKFKRFLGSRVDITDSGDLQLIVGIRITRDRPARTIYLDQTAYINAILARFGMADCTPVSTPMNHKDRLSASQCPSTAKEAAEYKEYAKDLNYLEIVGALLWVTQTRPDIQYAVGVLAQFGQNPGKPHLEAAKRILRYLKGTAHFKLRLGHGGDADGSLELVGWSDSDWAQDTDTRQSVGGFSFEIGGGHVSWSSKKQPTVATSTVESEYMAAANATKEAIWLRYLLTDLGHPPVAATVIRADNQGCIALSRNPVAHSRAKHIDIWHHFIRERVAMNEVDLQYCSTKDMIADIFTKALPRDTFEKFRAALGVGDY